MTFKSALFVLVAATAFVGCTGEPSEEISDAQSELSAERSRHSSSRRTRNRKLALGLFEEVFNEKNLDAAGEFIADDYIQHNPLVQPGLAGFQDFFEGFFTAVPDLHVEVLQVAAEKNKVFVYSRMTGTYTGDFGGTQVDGRSIDLLIADIWRVEDGKLAEHWDVFDNLAFMTQLGVIAP